MRTATFLLGAVGFLLAVGCEATTDPAKIKGVGDPYRQKSRIQWNTSDLKHLLDVEKVEVDRIPEGQLLRVRMILRNKTDKDVVVDIRTLFTDQAGFEKESTNWEPIVCPARTQKDYMAVSLSANVQDYQVIIRDPKNFSWRH